MIDKSKFYDSRGRALTQSLFLEQGYTDFAVYTLKEDDYEYKGKVYPSLKRLYVEFEDPVEYEFARKYLAGWSQWKQMNENKALASHIAEWREELMVKLRCQGVRDMIDQSAEGNSFQASKWLAEGGWDKKAVGRPSKKDQQKEQRVKELMQSEFDSDFARLQ